MATSSAKDSQAELREWLAAKFKKCGHGTAVRLAEHMGVHKNTISKIISPPSEVSPRAIKANELALMIDFLVNHRLDLRNFFRRSKDTFWSCMMQFLLCVEIQ